MADVLPEKRSAISTTLKVLALSAVGLLLAVGFCGLDAHLYPGSEFGGSWLAGVGVILGFASVLVFVGASLSLLILLLRSYFTKGS